MPTRALVSRRCTMHCPARKAQLVKAAYIGPAEQLALRQLVHRAVLPEPHRRAAQHHACSHARQAVALPLGRVAGIEDAERRFAALPQADTATRDPDGRLFRVFPAVFTRSVPFLCQCIRVQFLRLPWIAAACFICGGCLLYHAAAASHAEARREEMNTCDGCISRKKSVPA